METLPSLYSHFDTLTMSLEQADALLSVILTIELSDLKLDTIYNYLWTISNIVHTAKTACEKLFTECNEMEG